MKPKGLPTEKWEHGKRAKYVSGCRCEPCTNANREYARMRGKLAKDDWNGLVDASKARAHLLELTRAGIGRRTVWDITGVACSTLNAIRAGKKTKIRKQTETAILAVTTEATNAGKLVPAGQMWRKLNFLVREEGFTKKEIARRLGFKSPGLQMRKRRITAKTALRVERFLRELANEA